MRPHKRGSASIQMQIFHFSSLAPPRFRSHWSTRRLFLAPASGPASQLVVLACVRPLFILICIRPVVVETIEPARRILPRPTSTSGDKGVRSSASAFRPLAIMAKDHMQMVIINSLEWPISQMAHCDPPLGVLVQRVECA